MNINPFDLLKNAQKIQEQMSGIQEKLELVTAVGSSGGGMVEILINGKFDVISVNIKNQAVQDIQMLEDLVMAAFNDAITKIKETVNKEITSMTGGINIPGFPGVM